MTYCTHVAGCAASVHRIRGLVGPSDAEVRNSQIALTIKYKILRLDVSMYNFLGVDVLKA